VVPWGVGGRGYGVADHDKSTCGEIIGDLLEIRENDGGERSGLLVRAPEQDDTRRQDGRVGEELPEVGIGGYEDPVFPVCRGHDLLIGLAPEPSSLRSRGLPRAAAPPSGPGGTRRSGISRGEPDRKLAFIDGPRCIAQAGLHVGEG
jgi:hypothetical protein